MIAAYIVLSAVRAGDEVGTEKLRGADLDKLDLNLLLATFARKNPDCAITLSVVVSR